MDKNAIFIEAKRELAQTVSNLAPENLAEAKETVEKYFLFFERLFALPEQSSAPAAATPMEVPGESLVFAESEPQAKEEDIEFPKFGPDVDRLERKLRGGMLPDLSVFVPEKEIRRLGLEQGDWVSAKPTGTEVSGRTTYQYDLVQKGNGEMPENRVEIRLCKVDFQGGELVVRYSFAEGELQETLILSNDDVNRFGLKEGDIVDIAHAETNMDYVVVIWKHSVEGRAEALSKPSVSSKKDAEPEEGPEEQQIFPVLSGKTVLAIGLEPRRAVFKQAVEKRAGQFEWAEGCEGKTRLAALVRKSDVAVVFSRFVSHQGYWDIVELCKDYGIPFSIIEGFGVSSFINAALHPNSPHTPRAAN